MMKKFLHRHERLATVLGMLLVVAALVGCCAICDIPANNTSEVSEPPKYAFSEEEKELMACVLWTEAGINSDELKVACASVMLNQLDSGWYGATITEVLTRPGAYAGYAKYADEYDYGNYSVVVDAVHAIAKANDLNHCRAIVNQLCQNGSELPSYIWFFAIGGHPWSGLQTYDNIESVCFQYFPESLRAQGWH